VHRVGKEEVSGVGTKFYKAQRNMPLTKAQRAQSRQRREIWVKHKVLQGTKTDKIYPTNTISSS